MTEFAETKMRHYCRNPRCRSKLKEPVPSKRDAFCTRGCHSSFYRKRCLICECEMERKSENQLICGKRRCRNALQTAENLGRYHGPSAVKGSPKNVDFIGPKWVLVAGPPLTANQFHCATVPDGPDCQWSGGEYERIKEYNEDLLADAWVKSCRASRSKRIAPRLAAAPMTIEDQTRLAGLLKDITADLRIPDFLRRASGE